MLTTRVSCAKTAELIEMSFDMWILGPVHVLGRSPDLPTGQGTFFWGGGNTWACSDLPAVDILSFIFKREQRCGLCLPVL